MSSRDVKLPTAQNIDRVAITPSTPAVLAVRTSDVTRTFPLRRQRSDVGRDCQDVVLTQFLDDRSHHLASRTVARVVLDVEELAG